MHEHEVPVNPKWLKHGAAAVDGNEFEHLEEAIDSLFAQANRPTAILCGND